MTSLAVGDVDVGQLALLLAGNKLRGSAGTGTDVASRIVDGSVSRTMTGASTLTLTLEDERRDLIRSGLFDQELDVVIDDLWWRLVQVSKLGDQLTLTFEDRIVALLRKNTKPRKAARSKMTRAEFALSIVREVQPPIPFVCPDLHVKQPIEKASQKPSAATKVASAAGGIAPGAKLTIKGAPATASQRGYAERILTVAASLAASERATLALIEACIVESTMQNLNYGDRDSLGILQVRTSTAAGMNIDNRDVEQCANAFLTRGFYTDSLGGGGAIKIAAKHPEATTGQIAQGTQGSGVPGAYDKYATEAKAWLGAFTGTGVGASTVPTTGATGTQPFMFQRGGTAGKPQNSWECLQQLASDVAWVCFAANGQIVFAAETTLLQAKPVATLSEQTLGVSTIDFDVDTAKLSNDATVTAQAARWTFPPGAVVVLEDSGPADGRWLIDTIDRGLFDATTTIRLKRATAPLPEPAASAATSTAAPGVSAAGVPGKVAKTPLVQAAYVAAQAMDAKQYPYVWGGGHAKCGTPDHGLSGHADSAGTIAVGDVGYDCSGSTCAILGAAGMGFNTGGGVQTSGPIAASWGAAGKGSGMTVYANVNHVFIVFENSDGPQHFGTTSENPRSGPGFATMRSTDGFTPRHWPGT